MKNPHMELEYGILDNVKGKMKKISEPGLMVFLKACTNVEFDSK